MIILPRHAASQALVLDVRYHLLTSVFFVTAVGQLTFTRPGEPRTQLGMAALGRHGSHACWHVYLNLYIYI